MENFSDRASYAVAEIKNGEWLIEHVRVPYDVASAVEQCLARGREDWAHFLETGRKLETGIKAA